jgi:S-adenosylmethionine:tRNA ribosyltransferase-isomerase
VIAATEAVQRPPDAKLLVVAADGSLLDARRRDLLDFLRRGDLLIANDAATLPASVTGLHTPTGRPIEVRLAGRASLSPFDVAEFSAIVFGDGDFHTPTEHRPSPPLLAPGDRLTLGPLDATVIRLLDHPRLVELRFHGSADAIWSGIARHGRPIQYAHMAAPLALWDVWTVIAGRPVAFEPPSAGFVLDWQSISEMRGHGVQFATLTHAAGISSTGDPDLDARLPFDEPYEIPHATASAVKRARDDGRRVVAIGTTVVRALEHAARIDGIVRPGPGVATQRIGAASRLRVVHVILSGVHEPATSHYQLLRAFASDDALHNAEEAMDALGYRTHEFGDSVLIEGWRH